MSTTHDLTVIGPNLPMEADCTFRVHATGCRDIEREETRWMADPAWNGQFQNKGDVINDVYDFLGGEDSEDGDPRLPSARSEYWSEFSFAPCCDLVPV